MLVIRLFRIGKKNQPYYKVVVTKKGNPPKSGRFVEEVGSYDPLKKQGKFKAERIKYWIGVGAQPLDTVYNLLVKEKIIEGKKRKILMKSKKKETVETAPASAPAPTLENAGK